MRSANTAYLERLDHLRFAAAALVAVFHAGLFLRAGGAKPSEGFVFPLFEQGHVGVQLFMVISGFILGRIARDKDILAAKFYLNRVLRIYPLYVLVVALGAFSNADLIDWHNPIRFLMALTPVSNLARTDYGAFGGTFWSIAVELQFYLLFPLIHFLHKAKGYRYLLAVCGFFLLMRFAVYQANGTVHNLSYFTIFGAMDLFLAGIVVGTHVDVARWKIDPKWAALAAFLLINLLVWVLFRKNYFSHVATPTHLVVAGQNPHWLWVVWPDILGLVFGVLIVAYVALGNGGRVSRAFAWCGKLSYSMYIWHFLVITLARKYFVAESNLALYAFAVFVILPLTLALSALSYYVIEQPFLAWRVTYTVARRDESLTMDQPAVVGVSR